MFVAVAVAVAVADGDDPAWIARVSLPRGEARGGGGLGVIDRGGG
jgi:hypothetical protein